MQLSYLKHMDLDGIANSSIKQEQRSCLSDDGGSRVGVLRCRQCGAFLQSCGWGNAPKASGVSCESNAVASARVTQLLKCPSWICSNTVAQAIPVAKLGEFFPSITHIFLLDKIKTILTVHLFIWQPCIPIWGTVYFGGAKYAYATLVESSSRCTFVCPQRARIPHSAEIHALAGVHTYR